MKLKSWVPEKIYQQYLKPFDLNHLHRLGKRIYSQEGEDILIERYLGKKSKGFYIDIGAHHPFRFSNTYYFYRQGWSGINIEPNPELFGLLSKHRPHDINLNIGLSDKPQDLTYYSFEEAAYNTFSHEIAMQLIANKNILIRKEQIATTTLPLALKNLILPTNIDFLSIDTEGMDLDILMTNDWDSLRPQLILAELKVDSLRLALESKMNQYLEQSNYRLVSKLYNTILFKRLD